MYPQDVGSQFVPGAAVDPSGMETPAVPGMLPGMATPEMYNAARAERELWERNKPMSDEELDALLPGTDQVGQQEDEPCAGG